MMSHQASSNDLPVVIFSPTQLNVALLIHQPASGQRICLNFNHLEGLGQQSIVCLLFSSIRLLVGTSLLHGLVMLPSIGARQTQGLLQLKTSAMGLEIFLSRRVGTRTLSKDPTGVVVVVQVLRHLVGSSLVPAQLQVQAAKLSVT